MKNLCIIPARGGSKRIPRKNVKPFMGKPIIAYSIEAALNSGLFDEVMVSTDDEEIANVARQYGAHVPFMRSAETANDYAGTNDVLREVLSVYKSRGEEFDIMCCLYSTAPFVTEENLKQAYSMIDDNFDSSFTMVEFSYPIQRSLRMQDNKVYMAYPEYANSRSQDLDKRYHDAGQFYFSRVNSFMEQGTMWGKRTAGLILSELSVQDLDTETDWKLAEMKYLLLAALDKDNKYNLSEENKKIIAELMNKLVLGTVQFGVDYGINNKTGKVPEKEVEEILIKAKSGGVKTLDTSCGYGNSEIVLGKALKATDTRFDIVSKYLKHDEPVEVTFQRSLSNLQVDKLHAYLMHHFEEFLSEPDLFEAIKALKKEGKVDKVGFSIYTTKELQYLLDNNINFDIIQFPYNILDRQFEPYMPLLKEKGVEIHCRSAFLQGLFFKDTKTLSKTLMPLRPYLDEIHDFCDKSNISIEQLALNYVMANPNVDGNLIGVDNSSQLESNLCVADKGVSDESMSFVQSMHVSETHLLNPVNWN